jgi:hypothetical protein
MKRLLAEEIREYSRSQVELWRQVPWLALQATGRDGGMGNYSHAYCSGSWVLRTHSSALQFLPYIECSTGEIFCYHDLVVGPETDDGIIALSKSLGLLDASAVIEQLKQEASAPRPSWISREDAARRDEERQRLAKRLNLRPYVTEQAESA